MSIKISFSIIATIIVVKNGRSIGGLSGDLTSHDAKLSFATFLRNVFENWENTQFPKCHTDKMRY
jgi:hypothetical protein